MYDIKIPIFWFSLQKIPPLPHGGKLQRKCPGFSREFCLALKLHPAAPVDRTRARARARAWRVASELNALETSSLELETFSADQSYMISRRFRFHFLQPRPSGSSVVDVTQLNFHAFPRS